MQLVLDMKFHVWSRTRVGTGLGPERACEGLVSAVALLLATTVR